MTVVFILKALVLAAIAALHIYWLNLLIPGRRR